MKRFFLVFLAYAILSSCNDKIVSNLTKPNAELQSLPVGTVMPQGWIKSFLMNQRDGLTGHLEVAGFPFNTNLWMPPHADADGNEYWWRYEQTGYWIDGIIRCGYLLNDSMLINKAVKQIDYVLNNPDSTGYLGPDLHSEQKLLRWSHAVFFRSLMAYYDKTEDAKILEALRNHYLNEDYLYTEHREMVNIETILYCYEKTNDTAFLYLAEKIYSNWEQSDSTDASPRGFEKDIPVTEHGVTYNEQAKLGAIMYMYTGNENYLQNSIKAFERVTKYHMLADGMHSCTENMRSVHALESHEACDVSDFTWSLEYMLMATGDASYADMVEKVIFNALPGQVTNDFKALQYFSCPNQILATSNSNHNVYHRGNSSMRYAPNPWVDVQCCPANISRAMPNYVANMWMQDKDNNPVAVMYGPSTVSYKTAKGHSYTITEETNYPFEDTIRFRINTTEKIKSKMYFRIPEWAKSYEIEVNNAPVNSLEKNGFIEIEKQWSNNDFIQLFLPQEIKKIQWPGNGISIEKGPLVYALNIKQNRQINTTEKCSASDFPAYEMYPSSNWNYAIVENLNVNDLTINRNPDMAYPWNDTTFPITINVPAVQIAQWTEDKKDEISVEKWGPLMENGKMVDYILFKDLKVKGNYVLTPELPDLANLNAEDKNTVDTIELVPYGCTKLRVTIFPVLN